MDFLIIMFYKHLNVLFKPKFKNLQRRMQREIA